MVAARQLQHIGFLSDVLTGDLKDLGTLKRLGAMPFAGCRSTQSFKSSGAEALALRRLRFEQADQWRSQRPTEPKAPRINLSD